MNQASAVRLDVSRRHLSLAFLSATAAVLFGFAQDARAQAQPPAQEEGQADVTMMGVVGDFVTGDPVVGAFVRIGGTLVGITDDEGAFHLALEPGRYRMEIQRIGYLAKEIEFNLRDTPLVRLSIPLDPVPIALPEILVEAERTLMVFGPKRDFYRRMREGTGTYITRQEIEYRAPRAVSDVLRLVPGMEVNQTGLNPATFRVTSRGPGCGAPIVFVDGFQADAATLDIIAPPEQIEGIEVYTRAINVPQEFSRQGSMCGVIAVWTR